MQSRYHLTEDGRLLVSMSATTDRPTVLNMVHHSYWNMAGHASGPIIRQMLTIPGSFYTPVDEELLATGEVLSVGGTARLTGSRSMYVRSTSAGPKRSGRTSPPSAMPASAG